MKYFFIICVLISIVAISEVPNLSVEKEPTSMTITNQKMKDYEFLKDMYRDDYFPNHLVDKGKSILVDLCLSIESTLPKTDEELFKLTHAATERFNDLQEEFEDNDSEIETAARDSIGEDFYNILKAYGYEVDVEDAIAPRDW